MRSLSRTVLGPVCGLSLTAALLWGCNPSAPVTDSKPQTGSLMPVTENLKEQMEEKWLEDAVKGLTFSPDSVIAAPVQKPDRGAAMAKAKVAFRSLEVENIWFKAAGLFRDAILLDPTYAPPYEGLARALLLEGNLDKVEPALKTAVRLDPNFNKARFEYGTVVQMKGDYPGCIAIWKDLVARDPAYPDAYARLSIAAYFAQDYDAAYAFLAEADKRKQNVPVQFRPLLKEAAPRP